MKPTLDIIIVNWNSGRQLFHCVQSIAGKEAGYTICRVVIVDNGSIDSSLEELASLDLPITILRNTTNRGFAAACNQGAAASAADYLLFLNPDTVLNKKSISVPITFLQDESNAQIGVVGIRLVDEHDVPSRHCCRIPTPGMLLCQMTGLTHLAPGRFPSHVMSEWPHDISRNVGHVMGAFYLVRRKLFGDLGGFDERYFVYMEDLDFSSRVIEAGWRIQYLANVTAYHKGGGTSEQVKAARLFYSLRSRTQYSYKHFGWVSATGLLVATMVVEPFARFAWALKRGAGREIIETLIATSRLLGWIGLYPFRRGRA